MNVHKILLYICAAKTDPTDEDYDDEFGWILSAIKALLHPHYFDYRDDT